MQHVESYVIVVQYAQGGKLLQDGMPRSKAIIAVYYATVKNYDTAVQHVIIESYCSSMPYSKATILQYSINSVP